ncbi:PREDICTED: uncharacterized protein LOC106784133 [Polistes canadensis]|uniref:uncharacterized protein LOC106784133 n=1 Tax=Polistes canadensis TaxID=91411 RepID=UPI000718CB51|nr:PREDICTED: uncharacterized protein LOC106784133 [Polistes canadensis]
MESTSMLHSSEPYLLFLFYAAIAFYMLQTIKNLTSKKKIISERQTNSISDDNIRKGIERAALTHLPRKFMNPTFVEEFRKYASEYCKISRNNFDEFGEYVEFKLQSLKSEDKKKRLESEIRNAIMEMTKQDRNMLSSYTSANT